MAIMETGCKYRILSWFALLPYLLIVMIRDRRRRHHGCRCVVLRVAVSWHCTLRLSCCVVLYCIVLCCEQDIICFEQMFRMMSEILN